MGRGGLGPMTGRSGFATRRSESHPLSCRNGIGRLENVGFVKGSWRLTCPGGWLRGVEKEHDHALRLDLD